MEAAPPEAAPPEAPPTVPRTRVRVSCLAQLLDQDADHSWSKQQFGDAWQTARFFGTVVRRSGDACMVQWDNWDHVTAEGSSLFRWLLDVNGEALNVLSTLHNLTQWCKLMMASA
eukprot:TRINITY_DN38855_c0_g1_i1.p2 TRINITY_DN38855_c0_g1~~TRINITY_DN38855_c0_g1_i1.p2  ORF type:complete len:115 (+),score=23.15 TRINITY_DN38855_c0_g1_i1:113-457(+)